MVIILNIWGVLMLFVYILCCFLARSIFRPLASGHDGYSLFLAFKEAWNVRW